MSDDAPTGGQLCVRGILHQMRRGLAQGMSLALKGAQREGKALKSVLLTLEPAKGGDHQATTSELRIVEQVKIRTTGKAWTTGEIAGEVLPDLLLAVSDQPVPSRYRFTTDGLLNCPQLTALSERLRNRAIPKDPLAALDDSVAKAFNYSGWKSERGLFVALAKRAGCKDYAAFWELIANLELEGELTEETTIQEINSFLLDIVDFAEQVPDKRALLIVEMMDLATQGKSITIEELLEKVALPVERTLHYAKLPLVTRGALRRDLALLGYDHEHDVREVPRAGGAELTLFAGDSGFGKSWRIGAMLHSLDEAGQLAILVTNASSVEAIRQKIVDLVWHSSFDQAQSMPGLHRRLAHRFIDPDGVWLTVGIDDIQNRGLLDAIRAENWAQHGVRVIATVPTQIADELSRRPLPPVVIPVPRFSVPQVRKFLASYDRAWLKLPGDVVELVQTPIFADLYRRIGGDDWVPLTEYALIDRFWRHTTFETKGMADYQDDPVALEQLVRTLLAPTGRYPWSVQAAMTAGLLQEKRTRLVKSGVLRQSEAGIVMIHDRVLNWAVARTMVADLAHGVMTIDQVLATLRRLDRPDEIAPGLAYRLGYVLLDFLWLACRALEASTVAEILIGWLDAPEHRINETRFVEDHLAGLGAPLLPALAILARRDGEAHRISTLHAAKAIATIGRSEPHSADPTVTGLLAEGQSAEALRSGLVAAASLPMPSAIERLWDIHLSRRTALAAASQDMDPHQRHDLSDRARTSFAAIKAAAADIPEWIAPKLAQTQDQLSSTLLLELLMEVEHGAGHDIWQQHKATFLARIPAGKAILPRAIQHFGDGEEADRLENATDTADWLEPHKRYDALIRVAPHRAAAQLETIPSELLSRASWFSVRRLIRNGGEAVRPTLLSRYAPDWQGMAELAQAYWFDRLAIDQASFRAMLVALEGRLTELAGTPWQPPRERSLVQFLAETTRPDLLAILESYRGTNLERRLRDVSMGLAGRNSLSVDTDADHIERLLLMIGGAAFPETVRHAIGRDRAIARRDAYQAAIFLPKGAPAAELTVAAARENISDHEDYDLSVAVAVHGCDEPLYDLVMSTQAAFNDVIDIRTKEGSWSAAVDTRLRADLASPISATRIGAVCALAMAPPDDALGLLAATLERSPHDDPSALTVVRIAAYLRLYTPSMLPKLTQMLTLNDASTRDVILPFLAEVGDQAARKMATDTLASGAGGKFDRSVLRAAYALAEHEPAEGPASRRLAPFLDRHHGMYPVGHIARRLHDNKTVTNDALIDLGYSAEGLSSDCVFLLVDRIATFDRPEALAIATRRFSQTPSAGGARQILELGGADGIDALIGAYLGEKRHEARWLIGRALRRHGDRKLLLDRLEGLVTRNTVAARIAAAELAGWIPGDRSNLIIAGLADNPVNDVADAAMEAEGRLETERWGMILIEEMPSADHLGRWSRLQALVDLVDPYLLELDSDGLQISDLLEGLDEVHAIWVEKALVKRKKALIKQGETLDRRH